MIYRRITHNGRYHLRSNANSIGALHAATGDYDAGFYFAGAMILVSGIMLFLLPRNQRKTEYIYSQPAMKFLDATLRDRSAVAWQLGVPPHAICNTIQNIQDHNSDSVVTHL